MENKVNIWGRLRIKSDVKITRENCHIIACKELKGNRSQDNIFQNKNGVNDKNW